MCPTVTAKTCPLVVQLLLVGRCQGTGFMQGQLVAISKMGWTFYASTFVQRHEPPYHNQGDGRNTTLNNQRFDS